MGLKSKFTGLTGIGVIGATAAFYMLQPPSQGVSAQAPQANADQPAETFTRAADKAPRVAAAAEQPVIAAVAEQPALPQTAETASVKTEGPLERLAPYMEGTAFPADIRRLYRTASTGTDTVKQAQAIRELGQYFTGSVCEPNQQLGVALYRLAGDMGNNGAKIDLAYLQYHGKAGLTADRAAATEAMRAIDDDAARKFVTSWTGKAASLSTPRRTPG